jgi:hypothetical protein
MHHESWDSDMVDEHAAENEYAKLAVSEFIMKKYTDYNNEPIVKICYDLINGARELIMKKQNYNEADELCKSLKLDIYYYMTGDAGSETFANHMDMMMKMESYIPWEPYKLAEDYETKDVQKIHERSTRYKTH